MNSGVHFITIAFSIEKQRPDGMHTIPFQTTWVTKATLRLRWCLRPSGVDVLKESLDANKVLVENANVETANFALMFEFDGDVKKIRHCLLKQLRMQTV